MYHGQGVILTIGDFEDDEEAFNYALENDYGIELNYKYSLISTDNKVISESDDKQKLLDIMKTSKDVKVRNGKIIINE